MRSKFIHMLILILLLTFSWGGSAFAKDIVVLSQFPLSGPHGSLPEIGWGYTDAWTYFNEEAGGVGGKKVKWFMEDMRYDPTVEVSNFTRFSAQHTANEFLVSTGYITGALKALIKKVNEEEMIPWIDGSFSAEIFGKEGGPSKYPYYYSLGATYGDQIKVLVKWIAENHSGQGKPRVAFVNSPTSYGRDGLPEGLAYAKEKGLEIVAQIEYPYSAADATSECMTIRKSNAQYIIYHGYTGQQSATTIFLKTLRKVSPEVQFTGTHYLSGSLGFLVNGEAYNGVIAAACWPAFDAIPRSATSMDNAMVKFIHDLAKKYRPAEYEKGLQGGIRDMTLYFIGSVYAIMVQQGLIEAEKAGDLSRSGINKALENMVWDFMGMYDGQTFSYSKHTIPMLRLYKAKVKMVEMGGKKVPTGMWIPLGGWVNTDKVKW